MANELDQLADRVEQLASPCREADYAIHLLITRNEVIAMDPAGGYVPPSTPAYTESIDSARSLVPDGWAWWLDSGNPHQRDGAALGPVPERGCQMETIEHATGVNPAIALTVAALRARSTPCDPPGAER